MQAVYFNADGTVNHSLGRIEEVDGWLTAKLFASAGENGSLSVAIAKVER